MSEAAFDTVSIAAPSDFTNQKKTTLTLPSNKSNADSDLMEMCSRFRLPNGEKKASFRGRKVVSKRNPTKYQAR